jgi:hypothetical protein
MEILIIILICIILLWLILKAPPESYNCGQKSDKYFHNLPKINKNEDKTVVPIRFLDVPERSVFRYKNIWWEKKNFKCATSDKGIDVEIDIEAPVGALLQDIPEDKRRHILNI